MAFQKVGAQLMLYLWLFQYSTDKKSSLLNPSPLALVEMLTERIQGGAEGAMLPPLKPCKNKS